MSNAYFVMVGTKDNPLYEAEFGPFSKEVSKKDAKHMNQFVIHASLDIADEAQWTSNSGYLKVIDRFNEWNISAYILPSGCRFMLLHDNNNQDGIKHFFQEVHEMYIKVLCSK